VTYNNKQIANSTQYNNKDMIMPRRFVYLIIDVMGFIINQRCTHGFHDVYEVKKLSNN